MAETAESPLEHLRMLARQSAEARHALNVAVFRYNLALAEEMARRRVPDGHGIDLHDGRIKVENLLRPYPPPLEEDVP